MFEVQYGIKIHETPDEEFYIPIVFSYGDLVEFRSF